MTCPLKKLIYQTLNFFSALNYKYNGLFLIFLFLEEIQIFSKDFYNIVPGMMCIKSEAVSLLKEVIVTNQIITSVIIFTCCYGRNRCGKLRTFQRKVLFLKHFCTCLAVPISSVTRFGGISPNKQYFKRLLVVGKKLNLLWQTFVLLSKF